MRVGPRWVCGSAACSGQLPDERWNIFTLYHKTAGDGRDVYCLVGFMTAYRSVPPRLPAPHVLACISCTVSRPSRIHYFLPVPPARPPRSLIYASLTGRL